METTAIDIKSFGEQIQQSYFWREINPELTITEEGNAEVATPIKFDSQQLEKLLQSIYTEGYFQTEPVLTELDTFLMGVAIERLYEEGLPPVFAFVYDEFWQVFQRLSLLLAAVLSDNYKLLPSFWAWYIEMSGLQGGWRPHRDNTIINTLHPDGKPKVVTVWISLSDATPWNGCMYIVPANLDPYYAVDLKMMRVSNLQDIRALPAAAGSVLCWNHALLHWGGRSSDKAEMPRISLSYEFQQGDIEPYDSPLLDSHILPSFNRRLGLIGKQILQYRHMYDLPNELYELTEELKNKFL